MSIRLFDMDRVQFLWFYFSHPDIMNKLIIRWKALSRLTFNIMIFNINNTNFVRD